MTSEQGPSEPRRAVEPEVAMSFLEKVARIRAELLGEAEMPATQVVAAALQLMGIVPEPSWALPQMVDAIIVTSAGCSASMREAEHWIGDDGAEMASGVRDILEFLDEVDAQLTFSPLAKRICYDDPCHLIHAQGVAAGPRRLFEKIPELELVSHANPDACCGAAGIYNLTQPEMSKRVLSPKVEALVAANPEIVSTANPGCAMQISAGLTEVGLDVPVFHPIELLEEASRPR